MQIPKDLLYTRRHAWIKIQDQNSQIAVVGITDVLQETIGSIDFIELPAIGDELEMDIECLSIHSEEDSVEIPAPLTGRILAVNPELRKRPDLVHSSPYRSGWMYKMEYDEPDELEMLYNPTEYMHEVESEFGGYDDD